MGRLKANYDLNNAVVPTFLLLISAIISWDVEKDS